MNEISKVQNLIYKIRGVQVMLDSDLAGIYEIPVKRLNESAKRNIGKFPKEFMFQLTKDEYEDLKSQIATSNLKPQIATSSWGGRRKLPFVFSEHGVIMLSSVLNSEKAIQVNIAVVKAFVAMRRYIAQPLEQKIEDLERVLMLHIDDTTVNLDNHTVRINEIIEVLNALREQPKPERRPIGFRKD
ncbi:MAG: ORF6N domain-containing protein [Rickettsiales bacterium]|jgi:predicted nucleotide-binding protein|nr:ORF6N domain-containing protein [Rickettsiales bacterium]